VATSWNSHSRTDSPSVEEIGRTLSNLLTELETECHGVGRDINVQCVLIKEMIIIVDHYTLAVRNRR
jgi:hypothetical protein